MSTEQYDDADACAAALIERLDGRVSLALPLGLGKATHLANALYRRAERDRTIDLSISTALTLEAPDPRNALEARFIEPMAERLFANVPQLVCMKALRTGKLPQNVQVRQFYFRPGAYLGVRDAQQSYTSINYTQVADALLERGVNLIGQMVAPGRNGAISLSCNPDVTLDLLEAADARGQEILMVGELNRALPFMPNDASRSRDFCDMLLDVGAGYPLFPVPNRPVSLTEHAIALRIAGLVKDGGTLQIGIGSLGDAIAWAVGLRREQNGRYVKLLEALAPHGMRNELDALPQGLYGASEMFVEGFLHLVDLGVLRRTVRDGIYLHAGFFLGSARFYERLRQLPDETLRGINMTRISFTNSLLHGTEAKVDDRRDARFVNSAMMVTLSGAAVSDGLDEGQVVSGVGGQYNFVAMAQDLPGARSIIALPATRTKRGETQSNIVWNYGHVTIPRHLRDLVVTEYGVADLRNKSDSEVIAALLNVSDSRFQERLREHAVRAGKLPESHRIPDAHRANSPDRVESALAESGEIRALPMYPLGTDLTDIEARLAVALETVAAEQGNVPGLARLAWRGLRAAHGPDLEACLERMQLAAPGNVPDRLYRALVAAALADVLQSPRPLFPES